MHGGFYPQLTKRRPSGNHVLRKVCPMTPQLTPASGCEDDRFPRAGAGSSRVPTAARHPELGVRPGESDPAAMLSGVLLLVAVTIMIALALAWGLA